MSEQEYRAGFSGRLGFIMATSASAVGLGNLWRFPFEASHYGGGIFVLVYVIIAFTFGICLMMLEMSFGRKTGKSCIAAFAEVSKKYRFIGYIEAAVPLLIVPYYCVIGGWVTKWLFDTATGNLDMLAADGGSYWWDFVIGEVEGGFLGSSAWFLIFAALCVVCIVVGVDKGIEKLSKLLMPLLILMMVGLVIYELTIPGIWDGVSFYLYPKLQDLGPDTFMGAVTQNFFSMSIAMGILVTYGSYTKKDVDLEKSAITVGAIDLGVALLAGLMIVPVAFMFGFGDYNGMGLMFIAMPQVFSSMSLGGIIAPIFYLLVLFAALTSAVSLAETGVSMFMDSQNTSRIKSSAITALLIVLLGMLWVLGFGDGPLAFDTPLSQGAGWLGFFDTLTNNLMMPITAILFCLFIGYVVRTTFLEEEIELSSDFRLRFMFRIMVKYIAPVLLTLILISGIYTIIAG